MIHEIGHGELSHIPRGIVARIFNDMFWSPIAPQVPGLQSKTNDTNLSALEENTIAKILPQLVTAALSRKQELAADAYSIKMGISKLKNPCGMIDAIRSFSKGQDSLPFASHPNHKARLEAAFKVASEEGAGYCSRTNRIMGHMYSIFIVLACLCMNLI